MRTPFLAKKLFNLQIKQALSRISATLTAKVVIGLCLGTFFGLYLNIAQPFGLQSTQTLTEWVALPGHIFLGLLQMVVTPLVLSAVFTGIAGSRNEGVVKQVGWRIVLYFVGTTTLAICLGLGLVTLFTPGAYIPQQALALPTAATLPMAISTSWANEIINILPRNIFATLTQGDLLRIVVFSAIFGAAVLHLSDEVKAPLIAFSSGVQNACMVVVQWAMHIAPFAVFGLLTQAMASIGVHVLWGMSVYMGTVVLGLLLMYGFYLTIVHATKFSVKRFMKTAKKVQLLAFSTSSSASVMPLSLQTAEDLGVHPSIARLVVPLGATINMDGTALYQAVAAGFLAQVYGVPLGSAEFLAIIFTALGASIGAPGTPGVGIVTLTAILTSVGIPPQGVAIILGVDRLLDMCRTTLNVSGDLVASTVMQRLLRKQLPNS